jgi:hypothetical protein
MTEAALKMEVTRMRQRYGELPRAQDADTVSGAGGDCRGNVCTFWARWVCSPFTRVSSEILLRFVGKRFGRIGRIRDRAKH